MKYYNPFSIKPGEKLTPQQLFVRYLDWYNHHQSIGAENKEPSCDDSLHRGYLCCQNHMCLQSEKDIFFRYFFRLGMTSSPYTTSLSVPSMAFMITDFKLKITRNVKHKIKKYFGRGYTAGLALNELGI
jgi:hypothetical protein